ncbi:hypothetical protein EV715DRAFT_265528 [Schizophyllum commune]
MPLAVDTYTQLPAGRRFSVQYNSKLKPPASTVRPRAATYSSSTRPRIPPRASNQNESPVGTQHLRKPSLPSRLGPDRSQPPRGRQTQSELLSPGRSPQRRSAPSPSSLPRPVPSIAVGSEALPKPENAPLSDASNPSLSSVPPSALAQPGTPRSYARKNAHIRQQTIAKPDPNVLVRRLEGLLPPSARVHNLVQFDVLQALHDKEEMERFSREAIIQTLEEDSNSLVVFGESLTRVCLFASTRDGHRTLPSVVVSCMEDLKIRQVESSIVLPDISIACDPSLIAVFDSSSTDFGNQAFGALSQQPTDAVLSLLLTYLDALPEPLLFPGIADGLLVWCFDDSLGNDRKATISVAQLLLRLLPSANIALLSYLLESLLDLGLAKDAAMNQTCITFGRCMLGGVERDQRKGEVVLRWLLENWARISTGLMSDNVGIIIEDDKPRKTSPSPPLKELHLAPQETPRKSSWTGSLFGGAFGSFSKKLFDDDAIVYPGVLCSDSRSTSTGSAESASTYASRSTTDSDVSETGPPPYPCEVCRQCTPFQVALDTPHLLSLHSAHDICRLLCRRAHRPTKALFTTEVQQVEFHLPDDAQQRAEMLTAMEVLVRTLKGAEDVGTKRTLRGLESTIGLESTMPTVAGGVVRLGFSASATISVEGDGAGDAAQELGPLPASWQLVPRLVGRRGGHVAL